ncbi:MAG: POTRA domain-containing protein [Bacteroidota bacterium]|nr:POTRA domain-containing protein [Bacteroidota bacterium]
MNKFLSVILSVLIFTPVFGQEVTVPKLTFPDSTYYVGNIIIVGNDLTKNYIIEQEISLTKGSLITRQEVQYDINRVYSLRLFTKVEIDVVPDSGNTASLVVTVNERWYFYPFPVGGIKDRDFEKIYYGLGLAHNNVGGSNVQLYGAFAVGYDPFVSINYINPFIDYENKISLSLRAYYTEQRNRSLISLAGAANFDEKRSGGIVTVGKRFSLFTFTSFSVEYLNLKVSNNLAGRTISLSGRDEFFSAQASYLYDTRDLREYPSAGSYAGFNISKFGIGEKEIDYQRFGFDLRQYFPVSENSSIAGRVFGSIASGGVVPNYGHTFFGYNERIRGYFNTILEGEQILGSTIEAHYPIVSPRYIRFDFIPFEQFRDVRYAVNFAAFADAGTTWMRTHSVSLNDLYSGYGVGIHFLLAYSVVVRIELGIPYGKNLSNGELILDFGAAL